MALDYEFEKVGSGDEDGFNDALMTTFDMDIPRAVARESIQNIIDAAIVKPVVAEFQLLDKEIRTLPNLSQLRRRIKACREYFPHAKDCVNFFKSAQQILNGDRINIMKISDYNTKGLTGKDDDRNGNYYAFLKGVGTTAKASQEAGGSYGFGKGSLFAASSLKMIFVSSIYDLKQHVFQGKLRLVSHKFDGHTARGSGSFGLKGQKAVRDPDMIPGFFRRDKQGTDIFIPGFIDAENWKENIIRSVLYNFWLAILKNELRVIVGNIEIHSANLRALIYEHFDRGSENEDDNLNPVPYFEAYTSEKSQKYKETLPVLGDVECYILPGEKFPKRVACFRQTHMLIESKRFNSPVQYAGLFICESTHGNQILRRMEPPNHDSWDKNGPHAKRDGRTLPEVVQADKEYIGFIRSKLRELIGSKEEASLTIGDLSKYLYLPGTEDMDIPIATEPTTGAEDSEVETAVEVGVEGKEEGVKVSPKERFRAISIRTKGSTGSGKEVSEEGTGRPSLDDGDSDDGIKVGGEGGSAKEGKGDENIKKLSGMEYRSFARYLSKNAVEHRLIIHVPNRPNTQCKVRVAIGTDEGFDSVPILAAKNDSGKALDVEDGYIKGIRLNEAGEARVAINFGTNERYSIYATAYEDK